MFRTICFCLFYFIFFFEKLLCVVSLIRGRGGGGLFCG